MTLIEHIDAAAHRLPLGRGYAWPVADKSIGGCFDDLVFDNVIVLKAGPGTYCCGVTLEMLWRGWEAHVAEQGGRLLGGLSVQDAKALRREWFCIGTRRGPVDALVPRGLGVEVPVGEARRGDFAQLWRPDGSGHSVFVLNVGRGRISYLSTQRSTKGLGARVEPAPREIYVVRPIVPA